jgi:hypothetical protein
MLRFFRFNDPYRLVIVLIITVLLGIKAELEFPSITIPELKGILVGEMMADGKQLYSEVWDSMPPLTAFVQYVLDLAFDRSTMPRHILSWAFIFFQAAFFGILLINNKALNESGYLPSFLFTLLCFFSFDTVSLTREIIGSSLLLLALNDLLKEIEFKKQQDETIHNLGFYLGLASLSSFSYIIFFLGTALILFVFTRVQARRFGLFFFGLLLPHLLLNTWYFVSGNIDFLWSNFYLPNMEFNTNSLISLQSLLLLGLIPTIFFAFSLVISRQARFTKYQTQILQVMLLWLLFGLLEIYFTRLRTPQALIVCVPPLAYFISHLFLLIKRKALAETLLWILIGGLITINSLSVRQSIQPIDFSNLVMQQQQVFPWKDKKIMLLDNSLAPYLSNRPSGYFLEWSLCSQVFEDPGYYQHILAVAEALEKDPPEVIFDPQDLMKGVFPYLPEAQKQYRKENDSYIHLVK